MSFFRLSVLAIRMILRHWLLEEDYKWFRVSKNMKKVSFVTEAEKDETEASPCTTLPLRIVHNNVGKLT